MDAASPRTWGRRGIALGGLVALLLGLSLALLRPVADASSQILTVTGLGDTGGSCSGGSCTTLRAAVSAANLLTSSAGTPVEIDLPTGTIKLSAGVLTLGSASNMVTLIKGASPSAGASTIEQDTVASGVFQTPAVPGLTTNFQDLTITGGNAEIFGGGALQTGADGDAATFTNCRLLDNKGSSGGAVVMNPAGDLTIVDSTLSGNQATAGGGGAVQFDNLNGGGTLAISGSTFSGNRALALPGGGVPGGALYFEGATLTVTTSVFDANTAGSAGGAEGQGGAIWADGESTGSISLSQFTGNQAVDGVGVLNPDNRGIGGAILNHDGTLTVTRSRFAGNQATEGAAIEESGSGTVAAPENWWGSNAGPGAAVAADSATAGSATPSTSPWLQLRGSASPDAIGPGATATLTADLLGRSGTTPLAAGSLDGLPTFPAPTATVFSGATGGTLGAGGAPLAGGPPFVGGVATIGFTGGSNLGPAGAQATADSQSVPITLQIAAGSATALSSSVNPSVVGQGVTFTAALSSSSPNTTPPAPVDGTVQFWVDGSPLGSPAPVVSGTARSGTDSALAPGNHAVTATYSGGTGFTASTGALAGGQSVNKADTTTTVGSSLNPAGVGQEVTFSATVTVTAPGAAPAGGTVQFTDNGAPLGPAQPVGSTGGATFATSTLTPGTHAIAAVFSGDTGLNASTGHLTPDEIVQRAPTGVVVSSSTNPSAFGQPVSFTATVSSPFPGNIAGTLQFAVDGTPSGSPVSVTGGAAASAPLATLSVGTHTVTATYSGDATYAPAAGGLAGGQVVDQAQTAITVGTAPNPSLVGQGVDFTATVTVSAPGAGTPGGQVQFGVDGTNLGGPVPVGNTTAALPNVTLLTLGSHSVTATYLGDTSFAGSTSAAATQVVNGFPTTTTVTSSANPSVFGQPVAFAAQVSAGANGTPTGTVQFAIDGSPAGGPAPLTGGVAALAPNGALTVGTHTVTATYLGALSFAPSAGGLTGGQVVNQAGVTATLSSSTNPSVFGQPVTFTFTVTPAPPSAGTPTGSVQFGVDGANAGAPVPLTAVQAELSLDALAVGPHTVTATYSGDTDFAPAAASLASGQVVGKAGSATTVSAAIDPSVVGQAVTFSVTVTASPPGAGTPTGTVQVFVDRALFEQDALVNGALTTSPIGSLTVGNHVITAAYAGNDDFTASTSPNAGQTVNRAASVTTVTPGNSPSVFGQAVTFTAQVVAAPPGAGQPGGSVTFFADGTGIGSASLSGSTAVSPAIASLAAGSHTVTATYGGDANFGPSGGGASQTVDQAATTLTVTAAPNPSVFGEAVTFSATVTVVADKVTLAGTPDGTVQFLADGSPLGSPVPLVAGAASVTSTTLAVGDHAIAAQYGGATNFSGSQATASQHTNQAATAVSVATSGTPSVFGQPVTFSATVAPVAPGAGAPTGTVQFFVDGAASGGALPLARGRADLPPIDSLAVGTHTVTATYSGDPSFAASTGALAGGQTVAQAGTTTSLSSSANPSVTGQGVSFTATVAPVAPGAGSPSGEVSFSIDGAPAGTATVTAGAATLPGTTTLAVGRHTVSATYAGDASFSASTSAPSSQAVDKAGTATGVASASSPTVFGQPVTFTATVNAAGEGRGTPTGSVDFFADGVAFGTSPLSGSSAVSPLIATLGAGSHSVTATYTGDGSFAASSGSTVQVVTAAATTIDLTAAPNPARYGQPITFSATVTAVAPGAGTPTGRVQFLTDGGPLGAPVDLDHGVATLTESSLPAGTHSIDATYLGDANFQGSSDPIVIQVQPDDTATTVTSTANPSAFAEPVTFTATVAPLPPGMGTATGTVQFFVDGSAFGGPATLVGGAGTSAPTSSLAVGSHTVTATYTGNSNDNPSTSGTFAQVVSRLAPAVFVTATATPSVYGQPVTFTAEVTGTDGVPTGSVQFGVDGANLGSPVTLTAGLATSPPIATLASTLGMADHTVTATYGGDPVYLPGTGSATQTVHKADTTTGVTSSDNPSVFGAGVHFTATVAAVAPGGGTPAGSVQFVVDGANLGAPVDLSGGQADSPGAGSLDVGNHSVTALYLGGANYNTSSAQLAGGQSVDRSPTALDVSSSVNPSVFGQGVAFTATVRASGGGAGTPDGAVQFSVDGSPVGGAVSLSGGVAHLGAITSLTAGHHSVSAQYAGTGDYAASSGSLGGGQLVNLAATTTNLGSSENPSVSGDAVTFRATIAPVAPGAGVPGGSVTFSIDGASTGPQPMTGGVAAYTTSDLGTGPHTVTAAYSGDAGFSPSTGTLDGGQTVASRDMADLSVGIFGPHRAVAGLHLTYAVLVVNTGPSTATGVQLTDHLPGAAALGAITPDQGSCTAGGGDVTCSLGSLPAGSHTVVRIVVTPSGAGQLTDSASVSADQPDPNPTYNTAHLTTSVDGPGYWLLASDGGVFSFGGATFHGSTGAMVLNKPVVGMTPTPDGAGYWLVASDGGIFAFGDAGFFGSTGSMHLNAPIVGMAATGDGQGYWLVASDGGIFAFGDAQFLGSTGSRTIAGHIVAIAATPDGGGYWLAGSDGTVYPFGSAASLGSVPASHSAIVGIATAADGGGYWLAAADGSVYAFGDAGSLGSLSGVHLSAPIVGIAATGDGQGYWLVGSDGGVFAFGDAPFLGSMGGQHLNKPVIGMSSSG